MNPERLSPECAWALQVLFEARCGQALSESAERLRAHLEGCPRCQQAQAWDQRLAAALAEARLPPTPSGLEQRVHRWLRRRRALRHVSLAASAAALLAIGWLGWQLRPGMPETAVVTPRPAPPAAADDLRESVFLVSSPPVAGLEVLWRQQAAYVTVLEQVDKEW